MYAPPHSRHLSRNATLLRDNSKKECNEVKEKSSTKQVQINYLCNSVNNILVIILDGDNSLTLKHPKISDDLSFHSFKGKPEKKKILSNTYNDIRRNIKPKIR